LQVSSHCSSLQLWKITKCWKKEKKLKSMSNVPYRYLLFVLQEHFKPDWWQDGLHLPGWRCHTTSQLPKWASFTDHYNSVSRNNNQLPCDTFKSHVSIRFLFWNQSKMK
jgi:hypothetical protein